MLRPALAPTHHPHTTLTPPHHTICPTTPQSITFKGVTHTARLRELCQAASSLPHLTSLTLQAAAGAPAPLPPPTRSPDDRVPFERLQHLRTLTIDCQGWAWDVVTDLTLAVQAVQEGPKAVQRGKVGAWLQRVSSLGSGASARQGDEARAVTWGRVTSLPACLAGSSTAADVTAVNATVPDVAQPVTGLGRLRRLHLTSVSTAVTVHSVLQLLAALSQLELLELRGCCGPLGAADAAQLPALVRMQRAFVAPVVLLTCTVDDAEHRMQAQWYDGC